MQDLLVPSQYIIKKTLEHGRCRLMNVHNVDTVSRECIFSYCILMTYQSRGYNWKAKITLPKFQTVAVCYRVASPSRVLTSKHLFYPPNFRFDGIDFKRTPPEKYAYITQSLSLALEI